MKVTRIGTDYVVLNEENLEDESLLEIPKIHLIKMDFKYENIDKCVNEVINRFPATKRFIIENNIKDYNRILKKTSKKFYVENKKGEKLISFFRKNNKVLLNLERLSNFEIEFVKGNINDILFNVEVIYMGNLLELFKYFSEYLSTWRGNIILNE